MEQVPLVVNFLATVEGFVWTVGFDSDAELFPGGAVLVSKWYREELVVRIGIFGQGSRNHLLPEAVVA